MYQTWNLRNKTQNICEKSVKQCNEICINIRKIRNPGQGENKLVRAYMACLAHKLTSGWPGWHLGLWVIKRCQRPWRLKFTSKVCCDAQSEEQKNERGGGGSLLRTHRPSSNAKRPKRSGGISGKAPRGRVVGVLVEAKGSSNQVKKNHHQLRYCLSCKHWFG